MALDDFDDRFVTAVKQALDASRGAGDDEPDTFENAECPSSDLIASYYEAALDRVERTRLENHFSGCARCQGTLAALLRAAPMVDAASDTEPRAAAESAGIREGWFKISAAWRIAGVTAAVAAMIAVGVVAGKHVYQGRIARKGEQVAALSAASRNHNDSHRSSSDAESALDDKSIVPATPAEPKAATTQSAATAAPASPTRDAPITSPTAAPPVSSDQVSAGASTPATVGGTVSSESPNAPPEAAVPSREAAPPVTPADAGQGDVAAASAAQAAAALGALASIPASAVSAAPSVGAPTAAASAAAATASAATASIAAKAVATPASEIAAPTPTAAALGVVNQKQQELAVLAPPPSRLQRFQKGTIAQAPAKPSRTAPEGSHQSANVGALADSAGASALSARERMREQIAEKKLKMDVARKAPQAKRNADLKLQLDRARRDAQAKSARTLSARSSFIITSSRPKSAATPHMQIAATPRRASNAADGASSIGEAHATVRPAAPSRTGAAVATANRPVASAPVVAAIAPGIPVAPRAILVSPPDHSVYWSLQNSGMIYRTTDRKSWAPQYTGVQADLLAGTAPSDMVCWAVGRKGVILLTMDGIHWGRVNSPTSSDVVGITAASKDVATIFTAGGVSYSTFDGGSNWEQAN